MPEESSNEKWVGNASTHLLLAAMLLGLGTAWLLLLSGDLLTYWLPAAMLLLVGAGMSARAIKQLRARASGQ